MNEVVEYTYSKPEYYSEVNNFDDDYHEDDKVYETDDSVMNDLIAKLLNHKRRYTNFSEWCVAKEEYIEYVERLVAKYGGKKRFKFLVSIGMIDDYIPFCPILKRSKQSKMYIQSKNLTYIPVFKQAAGLVDHIVIDKGVLSKLNVDIEVIVTKESFDIKKFIGAERIEKNINHDVDLIDKYYADRVSVVTSRTKRQQRVLVRKEILNPKNDKGKSFAKLMKNYDYNLNHGLYIEDIEEDVKRIKYRDVSLTMEEVEQIDIMDSLRDIGVHLNKDIVGKKCIRLVKRRDEAVKGKRPKKKKDKKRKRGKEVREFVDKEYNSMEMFSQDLSKLSANILARNGVIKL